MLEFLCSGVRSCHIALWCALAALSGAIGAAAFAPLAIYPTIFVSLAALFYLTVRSSNVRRAAAAGWFWGQAYFTIGLSWTFHAMHVYGHVPTPVAALGVWALAAALAVVPAAVCAAARAVPASPLVRLVWVLPALWTLGEVLRGAWILNFGWLSVGYALTETSFSAWSPVLGVYGVGLIASLCSALMVALFTPETRLSIGVRSACALALGALAVTTITLETATWSQRMGQLQVRIVQPDLPVIMQLSRSIQAQRLNRVRAMSERPALGQDLDLIVWPEGIFAAPLQRLEPGLIGVPIEVSQHMQTSVLFNAFDEPERGVFRNSLWASTSGSLPQHVYAKRHLVPFGEYVPTGFGWFVRALAIPMSNQSPGALPHEPWQIEDTPVALGICYENMFAEELRQWWSLQPVPQLIINTANLAWFAPFAADQFTQMSVMRAQETARVVLQAVNNSHSALILPNGDKDRLAQPGAQNLDMTVPLYSGAATPFVHYGHGLVAGIVMLMLLVVLLLNLWVRIRSDASRAAR